MNKIFANLFVCRLILPMMLSCLTIRAAATGIQNATTRLYVAEGASGDGSAWNNALGDLSTALNTALTNTAITEIWVKAGTYKPSGQPYNLNLGDSRQNAFYLISGVALVGGFAGNETDPFQRVLGNVSILSGDIGLPGGADNCYHTIVGVNVSNASLGSFVIRDGHADGTGVNANMLGTVVDASSGGGLALYSSSPMIVSCTFTANRAGKGGAIFLNGGITDPRITQCLITGNTGIDGGGGIYNAGNTAASIRLCTITGNTSTGPGAGIFNVQSQSTLWDVIVWGNNGQNPAGVADANAKITASYSLVQGGVTGDGNLSEDPLFTDQSDPDGPDGLWMTDDDGLRPLPCSPAINRGLNLPDYQPAFDIVSHSRVFDMRIDMGAYELQSSRDGTSLAVDGDAAFASVPGGRGAVPSTHSFVADGCRVIAKLTPVGNPGSTDLVRAKVRVAGNVIVAGGFHFVQRYFDLKSSIIPLVYNATVTLFFTQSEFDAFNAVAGDLKLPASPSDATGKANLLIIDYSGFDADSPIGPGNGSLNGTIDPDDDKIVWNANLGRWEVSFVSGLYNAFFVTNGQRFPLKLVDFSAKAVENTTLLEWLTAEEVNTSHFEIHRSADARQWEILPDQPAAVGSGGHRYSSVDREPMAGLNYYRLKMIDRAADRIDSPFAFSRIVTISHKDIIETRVFPNPATNRIALEVTAQHITSGKAELVNASGTVVWEGQIQEGRATVETGDIPRGTYLLRVQAGAGRKTLKVVIQ